MIPCHAKKPSDAAVTASAIQTRRSIRSQHAVHSSVAVRAPNAANAITASDADNEPMESDAASAANAEKRKAMRWAPAKSATGPDCQREVRCHINKLADAATAVGNHASRANAASIK